MTWTWQWSELASPEVISWLYDNAGPEVEERHRSPDLALALADLFSAVGGLPLSAAAPDLAQLAQQLIGEACAHVLARVRRTPSGTGVVITDGQDGPRAVASGVVDVNVATAAELADLPILGGALARRIVAERRRRGGFGSVEDLDDRVAGIGPAAAEGLRQVLSFVPATHTVGRTATSPAGRLSAVVAIARHASHDPDPVMAAVDLACTVCASTPHPASRDRVPRWTAAAPEPASQPADSVELLGESYHGVLLGLFGAATETIEVCLFHAAVGAPGHPTLPLVEALADATARGVSVRVLLDRDRPSDPYRSTVINAPAVGLLRARGVPVRMDLEDRLLHSKVVVVDGRWTVIGSHNWSLGSFGEMDDVSVLIDGTAIAAAQTSRFDTLWDSAPP